MNKRDIHAVGHLERRHSSYEFGLVDGPVETPDPPPDVAQTGIALAVAKATCAIAGGTWDDASGQCMSSGTTSQPIDTSAQMCTNIGGVWDPVNSKCLPAGSVAPEKPVDKTTLFLIGAGVLVAGYLIGKRM